MNTSSPIDHAINSQLILMVHILQDILDHVVAAQGHIDDGERNAAIGALLCCTESLKQVRIYYDAILTLHRNAALLERHNM